MWVVTCLYNFRPRRKVVPKKPVLPYRRRQRRRDTDMFSFVSRAESPSILFHIDVFVGRIRFPHPSKLLFSTLKFKCLLHPSKLLLLPASVTISKLWMAWMAAPAKVGESTPRSRRTFPVKLEGLREFRKKGAALEVY